MVGSCLYQCEVMHRRLYPKQHKFSYSIFMFCVDLDEIDSLERKLILFSRNRFNWFSFRDADHLQFPLGAGRNSKTVKQNVLDYLESQQVETDIEKIVLITNVAVLGYSFNPISFYICYDTLANPVCSVGEVCNTHGEMKLYMLDSSSLKGNVFQQKVIKHFYVSPFASLESSFDFIFSVPGDILNMRVDDYENNKRFLVTSLTGIKKRLTDMRLLWYGLRFPLIPLRIMALIHWHALLLFLKRVPHRKKNFTTHFQRDAYSYKN